MGVTETVRLVSDLGFMVVAAAVFIYLAFKMFQKQQDWLEKFITNNASGGGHHPSREQNRNLNLINDKIHAEMQRTLQEMKADRTFVVLYHNGGKASSGLFFQKMSCICEVVSSGIQPFSHSFQNIHRGSYTYMLDWLERDGEILIDNYEDVESMDTFLYAQCIERHVRSTYYHILKSVSGDPIGFIGIDYCEAGKHKSKPSIHKCLVTVSARIASLVDVRDEVN